MFVYSCIVRLMSECRANCCAILGWTPACHEAKEVRVVPIILRPCDWTKTPFAKLQAKPKDAKPVTLWRKQDEAFLAVAKAIRECIDEIRGKV
jgi:hypothetical protein